MTTKQGRGNIMKTLKQRFEALPEEKKQEVYERFGGDCFEDIREELENNLAYHGLK